MTVAGFETLGMRKADSLDSPHYRCDIPGGRQWMKEAMLYERIGHRMVHCHLCPHECVIPVGRNGYCGVRKNIEGTLYTLTYGQVASVAIDPIEKKPLYHFYPGTPTLSVGTFGCNLRCRHCQNWDISHHNAEEAENAHSRLHS